jgi:hypothetical protein
MVRLIQEARKSSGLDVTDRIVLRWTARDEGLAATLAEHAPLIAGEILAVSFGPGDPVAGADPAVDAPGEAGARREAGVTGPWHEHADAGLGLRFWLAVAG